MWLEELYLPKVTELQLKTGSRARVCRFVDMEQMKTCGNWKFEFLNYFPAFPMGTKK